MEKIVGIEDESIHAYRNTTGGREKALMNDLTSATFFLQRVTHLSTESGEVYQLRMPDIGGGCPVVMVRSLSAAKDGVLRRLAEAHLWQFVSWQDSQEGCFRGGRRFFVDPTIFLLDVLSWYDHPIATLGILRAVPWIIRSQNEDGSWGEEPYKESATRVVLETLGKVSEHLSPVFVSGLPRLLDS
jgi:hypothetical protein